MLSTDLKNIWQYCGKENLQQNTYFNFYIDVWNLIETRAENTPSAATVGINITQKNPTLKLVTTQFEMNAKHSKRRSDQVFKMSSTSFHTTSSVKNLKSTADAGKRHSSFRARVRRNAQFATVSSCG